MILMGHGAGGRLSHQLVEEHFLPRFGSSALSELMDAGVVGELALTTDAFVVTPRVFPGGCLGRLAAAGTINDLCMVGAVPVGLSAAFILEEGFSLEELDLHVQALADCAAEAGVPVVAGDTKVVPRGAADGLFITTSGVGRLEGGFRPSPRLVRPGDAVIVSGTLGDHGMAVMALREGLALGGGELRSDVAPLAGLVRALRGAGLEVHAMRDPTRGGAAQSLLEIAGDAGVRITLDEAQIPVRGPVRAACEILGLDPLYVANEGKLLLILPAAQADEAVAVLRDARYGQAAAVIGRVEEGRGVVLRTSLGTTRSLRMAAGELLPRIC
ncbi:MAG: hydrogenase expression/formation protein HypE [Deltaproteobacteria bacterium]|nr:hydrogenase expression/formation protein HypE [Deltaproteobacteria bacterium]